jgi:hypothetical protein
VLNRTLFPVPLDLLKRVRVSDGSTVHAVARIDADFVEVAGSSLLLPVRQLKENIAHVNVGRRVTNYLDAKVDAPEQPEVVAAAVITAAVLGYPRKGKSGRSPGGPLDRVWTDHIALANGDDPKDAMNFTSDTAPQSDHILRMRGLISYSVVDD